VARRVGGRGKGWCGTPTAQVSDVNDPQPARRNKRHVCRPPKGGTKAYLSGNPLGLGANLAVSVLDLSESGVRLVVKTELRPGQGVEVHLEHLTSRAVKVPAEVVWCLPGADGRFVVGARFVRPLAYADLLALARA
jgi:hypothetical protein